MKKETLTQGKKETEFKVDLEIRHSDVTLYYKVNINGTWHCADCITTSFSNDENLIEDNVGYVIKEASERWELTLEREQFFEEV